jgi:predicted ATP-dependent endonuclease of OLD family
MKYKSFIIKKYKGISEELEIDVSDSRKKALIGLNESGKSTILKGLLVFDNSNDLANSGKHLVELNNYYSTKFDPTAIVTAKIEIEKSDSQILDDLFLKLSKLTLLNKRVQDFLSRFQASGENEDDTLENEQKKTQDFFKKIISGKISLTRHYDEMKKKSVYYIEEIEALDLSLSEWMDDIVKVLLNELPAFVYMNSVESEIPHKINPFDKQELWNIIFNKVFVQFCEMELSEVFNIKDVQMVDNIITGVESKLNESFMDTWKEFSIDNKFADNLEIKIKKSEEVISPNSRLIVSLNESIVGMRANKKFNINQRSDGFQWYYAFIMQILFSPYEKKENKGTIFLLDEPGLYLHPSAQTSLLRKIVEIVNKDKNKTLIYTTHSQYMLKMDSDYMNVKDIYITEKNKEKFITLQKVENYEGEMGYDKRTVLEPLYEALHIPEINRNIDKNEILFVEGLYDYYALTLFTDLEKEMFIYGCRGATSIIDIIPRYLFIMKKQCSYLVDNDKEGIEARKKIIKHYELKGCYLPFDGYLDIGPNADNKVKSFTMNDTIKSKLTSWSSILNVPEKYENVILHMWNNKRKPEVKKLLEDKDVIRIFTKISQTIRESFK